MLYDAVMITTLIRIDDEEHSDIETSESENQDEVNLPLQRDVDWKQPILVTGKPGCGKTHLILHTVEELIKNEYSVVLTAPTAFLASQYAQIFHDSAPAETVHAAFHYPVAQDEKPDVNWCYRNIT